MTPKFSVVIGVMNHLTDLTIPCLESIAKYTDPSLIEVIIVANGCTDDTDAWMNDDRYWHPSIKKLNINYVNFTEPLGYACANNEGILRSKGEYIILLNNDAFLLDQLKNEWLEMLEKPFIDDPTMGITGPLKLYSPDAECAFIVFFCVMLSNEMIKRLGLLDEKFKIGAGEDIDYCRRALRNGYKLYQVPDDNKLDFSTGIHISKFPIYHKGESTVHDYKNWKEIFAENMKNLRETEMPTKKAPKRTKRRSGETINIIMPVYNGMKTIEKSIDGIINQTFKDWRLWIVDDCSTDGTYEWLLHTKFNDWICKRGMNTTDFEILRTPENSKPAIARNLALSEIPLNSFVALCDADDVWAPNHLETSVELLKDAKVDLVYCTPNFVVENGSPVFPNWEIPFYFDVDILKKNNYIFPSSVVYRNVGIQFDPDMGALCDYDMWIRMIKSGYDNFVCKDLHTIEYLFRTDGTNYAIEGASKDVALRQKHSDWMDMTIEEHVKGLNPEKLNLGCGDDIKDGWINIDLYSDNPNINVKMAAEKLDYPDNFADEIFASHIIEHYCFQEVWTALREWYRVLKVGGKIGIETPDFMECCKGMVEGPEDYRISLYGQFFATAYDIPAQVHRFLFTEQQLKWMMTEVGFKDIVRTSPDSSYAHNTPPEFHKNFLKVEATK